MTFSDALAKVMEGRSLTRAESRECMTRLMKGELTPVLIAAFLVALRQKGETSDEIAGAAEAMREAAIPVRSSADPLVDTCGTGGDGQGSFNVSTAAAFVVAGAGFTVAKHGNRSITSSCGSADVLEALGVPVALDATAVERCLQEVGIAFLFAPAFHPAMKNAMPVRKELGIRTVFNLLGPLTNPARPNVQVVGVFDPTWVEPVARVLVQLGCRQGCVVDGQGHDEIIVSGVTQVAEIVEDHVETRQWTPEDFGRKRLAVESIHGGDAAHNAAIIRGIFSGQAGAPREAVCLNAAAAIRAASRQQKKNLSLSEAYQRAEESIDGKKAQRKLEQLRDALNSKASHG